MRESGVYISSRIAAAGGVPAEMFTREAVTLIHEFSRGIPRTINVIADNALLGGFAKGQRLVTRDLVREVCRDFDISRRPPPARGQASTRREATPVTPPRPPSMPAARLLPSDVAERRSASSRSIGAPPSSGRATLAERVGEKIGSWPAAAFSVLGLK